MTKKLLLVSTYTCPYVHRARILLEEKGAAYDIDYIDLVTKPQWFVDISPLGTVPILRVTDTVTGSDTTLFESQVICEYLDEVIAPRLHPQDPLERALNRAWIEYASRMTGALGSYTFCMDETELESKLNNLKPMLARLDTLLAQRNAGAFFNGNSFSLVDAAFAPFAMRYYILERHRPTGVVDEYPRVKSYLETLTERDSVTGSVVDTLAEEYRKRITAKGGALARFFPE